MSQLLDKLTSKEGYEKSKVFYQYLRETAFEKGLPLIGSFELTPRCNLDCKMCYVHLNNEQMKHNELTTEQWISLIDEACDAGMIYATMTGGECLLYPGFKKIYEHLQSLGVLITILTNGTLLDEQMVAWIAARSPQRVQISVYGSSPKGYETVTGNADAFYKVDHAIDLVKKAGIPFNLAITVSKQMFNDFEATLKYCRSKEPLNCDVNTFPFEARKETGRDYANYSLSLDEQVEIFKIRLRIAGKEFIPFACEGELMERSGYIGSEREVLKEEKTIGIPCTAGRVMFSINWDGRMLACNTFGFAEAFPLKDGFNTAWDYINKRSCEYNMPSECFKCVYKSVCMPCPAVHWLYAGEGELNPRVCEEGKRMALEGIRKL